MAIAWGTDNNLDDSQFYNRTKDLDFLRNILNSSQYGSTPTILLSGVRGVGKTALINKLTKEFNDKYLVISIDLSESDSYQKGKITRESFMELMYNKIILACDDFALITTLDKKIEKYLKTHDINLIKDFVSYKEIPIPLPGLEDNYRKLADFVMNLPQRIYEDYSDILKGVFIFIDEFQIVKEIDEYNSFLWYIRNFVQSQKNVAYIFSGSMSIKDSLIEDIAGKSGAFGGRMLTVDISPFSFKTTRNYLKEKANNLDFTPDGMERFYKCTKGIPFYINTFARLMTQNITLDEETVKKEFNNALPYLALHLINQWDKLTLQEQKIITTIVNKPIKRGEIAEKLDVTSGSISRPLVKLQNNALIEINDEKKYQIADNILALWLKREFEHKGVYPYRSI